MTTPDFPENSGVSLSERAARTRCEFYRLLPHFVRLPEWENITTELTLAGLADRSVRMWAVITRTGQCFPSTTPEVSVKAALVGLDLLQDAVLLAAASPIQPAPGVELVDGMIMSALNEDDRDLFRQPGAAAEYLVRFAAELGINSKSNHSPLRKVSTMCTGRPEEGSLEDMLDEYLEEEDREYLRQLHDPVKLKEELARIKRERVERRKKPDRS